MTKLDTAVELVRELEALFDCCPKCGTVSDQHYQDCPIGWVLGTNSINISTPETPVTFLS